MIKKIDTTGFGIHEMQLAEKVFEIIDVVNEATSETWHATAYIFPALGQPYWYVSSTGKIKHKEWEGSQRDSKRKTLNNCFPDTEEADKARKKIKEALKEDSVIL